MIDIDFLFLERTLSGGSSGNSCREGVGVADVMVGCDERRWGRRKKVDIMA